MYVTLRNGEEILIEADRGKIKLTTDHSGNITIDGCDKYKKLMTSLLKMHLLILKRNLMMQKIKEVGGRNEVKMLFYLLRDTWGHMKIILD